MINLIFGFIAAIALVAMIIIFMFAPLIAGCVLAENPFEIHSGFLLAELAWYGFWHFKLTEE